MGSRFAKNLFVVALVISLFIHLGVGFVVYLKHLPPKKGKFVEFVIVDKSKSSNVNLKNNAKQIVEQSEKRINDEIDGKTKFLSRYDQKVVEQTRAANSGKFQNDAKMGEVKKTAENKRVEEKQKVAKNSPKTIKQVEEPSTHGDVSLPKFVDLKPQFHWDKLPSGVENPGPISQSDDFLKDLQTGPQTLLSTRESLYYTYYTRIKDQLRPYWEPKVKEKVTGLYMSGRHVASDEEKITKLNIILDQNGKIIKVQVVGASGFQEIDDAAIEAFQAAAPFPNPPKGLIESDGTVKIRWDFALQAHSSLFSHVQNIATN